VVLPKSLMCGRSLRLFSLIIFMGNCGKGVRIAVERIKWLAGVRLEDSEDIMFINVTTVGKCSRIADYSCQRTHLISLSNQKSLFGPKNSNSFCASPQNDAFRGSRRTLRFNLSVNLRFSLMLSLSLDLTWSQLGGNLQPIHACVSKSSQIASDY